MNDLRERLRIPPDRVEALNAILMNRDMRIVDDFLAVVAKYGTPEEINEKAAKAGNLEYLMAQVKANTPAYYAELEWLIAQKESGAFVTMERYKRNLLGDALEGMVFDEAFAVTLEVSALQYFPWLMTAVKQSIANQTLLPARFIRVRKMKEQEEDGDLTAVAAAMQILGASYVETLDTKGTDGSNIHLGGAETIAGYFGGIGQPNSHALKWVDEYLYYYTNYGVRQVLNINPGTVFLGYMLHRLGVDMEFKISVFMGNDNPYAAFWTLMGAKLFARDDGTTPLIGFNWSNSVNNESIEITAQFRKALGFEDVIRFEHHITETWKHIIIQPYDRRDELLDLADHVSNISAKHEGGDPEVDGKRPYPSDVLDYFRDKSEIVASGAWDDLERNFLDKMDATAHTGDALTMRGLSVAAAAVHNNE